MGILIDTMYGGDPLIVELHDDVKRIDFNHGRGPIKIFHTGRWDGGTLKCIDRVLINIQRTKLIDKMLT